MSFCRKNHMNMALKILSGSLLTAGICYLFGATAVPYAPIKGHSPDTVLLKTNWKQMGGFEKYTPDHLRLGCWSTALAQIMYYHKLKPFGEVSYTSRNGYVISEKIDSTSIDLKKLVTKIDSSTSAVAIDATARYNYYAALAVRKDFGTDRYMNKLAPASLLEQHYRVKVDRYISWHRSLPYGIGKLERVMVRELDQKRPVMLHFSDLKGFGHSVVVDGYRAEGKKLMVHINQGQGGPQDGWYDFSGNILQKDDDQLRVVYTFRPL